VPQAGKPAGIRRRRTWTHSSTEGSVEGAHAVEFSKTVALFKKVVPSQGTPGERTGSHGGRTSIAPKSCPWEGVLEGLRGRNPGPNRSQDRSERLRGSPAQSAPERSRSGRREADGLAG